MKDFIAGGKTYILDEALRLKLKPDWYVMLNPVKTRETNISPLCHLPMVAGSEGDLTAVGEHLVGKDILEVGCGNGEKCYLMAKYEGTRVHGIDVDEYTVDQSPDVNVWNPADMKFIHDRVDSVREKVSKHFPENIAKKVSFSTIGMENYTTPNKHDVIVSFDVLEHLIDLDGSFRQMADNIKPGGIMSHEHNSFFSINGGHSLCTLDFYYGHCRVSPEDFERYVRDYRPGEHEIAIDFYNKCLNRATRKDIIGAAEKYGFELVSEVRKTSFTAVEDDTRRELEKLVLPDVLKIYPKVEVDDLLYNSIHFIMRKK